MNLTELYMNDDFDDYLLNLSRKRRINDFDDFKQDLFVYMLSDNCENIKVSEAKKTADKIAQRVKRKQMYDSTISFNEDWDSIDGESDSSLWEDRHII